MDKQAAVLIVGAGPAGLFAAHELAEKGIDAIIFEEGSGIKDRNCPKEQVGYCTFCKVCHFIHGTGGSGLFSDGKLNLHPEIGGNMLDFLSKEKADEYIEKVDSIFVENGAKVGRSILSRKDDELVISAKRAGVKYIPIVQRHIGSDVLPNVIRSIQEKLEGKGIRFIENTRVTEIMNNDHVKGLKTDKGEEFKGKYVVISPGRGGAQWTAQTCKALGISTKHQPIDVGVRVETSAEVMEEVTSIAWDPKFHIQTPHYDDFVRTFCTNPKGFVISETYGDFVSVNGHAMKTKQSGNTNFAFLVRMNLTEPVENTTQYGESIAKLATTIGGGRPLLQRLGDLRAGRRSTWERLKKSYVEPTLKYVTPGDISMALPGRIITNIVEGLEMLNRVVPGIAENSTLLYAPEIKFHALRVNVSKNMETSIKNLFAAGDGCGVSRGIVGAAVTGMIGAHEIIAREGK